VRTDWSDKKSSAGTTVAVPESATSSSLTGSDIYRLHGGETGKGHERKFLGGVGDVVAYNGTESCNDFGCSITGKTSAWSGHESRNPSS
jgi:hypothetical protein